MRVKAMLCAAVPLALGGLLGLGLLQGVGVSLVVGALLLAAVLATLLRVEKRRARREAEASASELRALNVKLQATQSQLLFAERLVTVGQLAAGVSHEINNPLSYILGNLDYVRAELGQRPGAPAPEERRRWLEALSDARDGAERIRLLVRDLQNLTRAECMVSGPVDLGAVVRSAAKMAGHEIRDRAQLVLEVDGAPEVNGNSARLCQVFLNLLLNAAHAIEPGDPDAHRIHVTVRPHGPERLRVEVRDTGCGIPAENLARIFDPFFTTKPRGVGMGMGLAVCHTIITAHGGDIRVESTGARGTTFHVELPLYTGAAPSRSEAELLAASAA